MRFGTMCIALAILAASPVLAHAGRYELIPEPDVRQASTNRVASAYVIDKKASQFCICTARYNFQDLRRPWRSDWPSSVFISMRTRRG
jgi:hypothetical protein